MATTDFKKLLEHPEKQSIISKLVGGESAKNISTYLKDTYPKPDQAHLRLPATMLQEFLDTYADHHGYVKKVLQNDVDSKLDKRIAESLLNNKEWKQRLEEARDKQIDFKERLSNLLVIIEARTEQLFDLIQSNPESTKTDYVFTKYLEILMQVIEKGDKLFNDKPDVRIEHTYTVQMVEQHTVVIQEVIRRVLERIGSPELAYKFMDMMREEMLKLTPNKIMDIPQPAKEQLVQNNETLERVFGNVQELDERLLEVGRQPPKEDIIGDDYDEPED
jgi:hypothetical protein